MLSPQKVVNIKYWSIGFFNEYGILNFEPTFRLICRFDYTFASAQYPHHNRDFLVHLGSCDGHI